MRATKNLTSLGVSLTFALIFLTLGCSRTYVHPTKNSQDFKRDKTDCVALAGQSRLTGFARNGFISDCLEGRGWREQKINRGLSATRQAELDILSKDMD